MRLCRGFEALVEALVLLLMLGSMRLLSWASRRNVVEALGLFKRCNGAMDHVGGCRSTTRMTRRSVSKASLRLGLSAVATARRTLRTMAWCC
jgi:hypothetical protein